MLVEDVNLKIAQKRVLKMARKWDGLLSMGWVHVHHKFSSAAHVERIGAETICDWEYRQATIVWYVPQIVPIGDEELEIMMVHELVHVLIEPLWDSIRAPSRLQTKVMELTTENVCRALYDVHGR